MGRLGACSADSAAIDQRSTRCSTIPSTSLPTESIICAATSTNADLPSTFANAYISSTNANADLYPISTDAHSASCSTTAFESATFAFTG